MKLKFVRLYLSCGSYFFYPRPRHDVNISLDNGLALNGVQIHLKPMRPWFNGAYTHCICHQDTPLNTLSPRQDGRHFPDDIFKWIFLNENCCILIQILLKYVPKGPINNNPSFLIQIIISKKWRQAIIWINDGQITYAYMRLSASMS